MAVILTLPRCQLWLVKWIQWVWRRSCRSIVDHTTYSKNGLIYERMFNVHEKNSFHKDALIPYFLLDFVGLRWNYNTLYFFKKRGGGGKQI